MRLISFCFLAVLALVTKADDQGHGFASRDKVHDAEHIKQHLGSKINVEAMNEQKQRFHYFKLHDLNKDGTLDGLEIIKALNHEHDDGGKKPRETLTDTQIENLVDAVLQDMDLNLDGRIDFSEYLRKQQA